MSDIVARVTGEHSYDKYIPYNRCEGCGFEALAGTICRSCHGRMRYTGRVKNLLSGQVREYEPHNAAERIKLEAGFGVVFE